MIGDPVYAAIPRYEPQHVQLAQISETDPASGKPVTYAITYPEAMIWKPADFTLTVTRSATEYGIVTWDNGSQSTVQRERCDVLGVKTVPEDRMHAAAADLFGSLIVPRLHPERERRFAPASLLRRWVRDIDLAEGDLIRQGMWHGAVQGLPVTVEAVERWEGGAAVHLSMHRTPRVVVGHEWYEIERQGVNGEH